MSTGRGLQGDLLLQAAGSQRRGTTTVGPKREPQRGTRGLVHVSFLPNRVFGVAYFDP